MRGPAKVLLAAALLFGAQRAVGYRAPSAVLPMNGDEVSPDLSDPGLEGAIRVHVRVPRGRVKHLVEEQNQLHSLGPALRLVDHRFAAVPAEADYRRRDRLLTIRPESALPPAQYTLEIDPTLLVSRRRRTVEHLETFRTSFTVGPDVYGPVLRDLSPAPNQSEVPRFAAVSAVFNESLDPATCVLGRSVLVEDVGKDPPVAVTGTLTLAGNGFVLEFVPDPCSGHPPSTRIRIRLAGGGDPDAVRDRAGNRLEAALSFEFDTKGDGPLADHRKTPPPADALYVTTGNGVAAFDLRGAIDEDGSLHPEAIRRVVSAEGYGGDFEARLGRPGEAVLDPRTHPESGHSFLYAIDEEARDVAVVETATGRVVTRLGGFAWPRALGIVGPAPGSAHSVLMVADAGARRLIAVPVGAVPGHPVCEDLVYDDAPPPREIVAAGLSGIAGIAAVRYAFDPMSNFPLVMAAIPRRSAVVQLFGFEQSSRWEFPIEPEPTEAAWSPPGPLGASCWITAAAPGKDGGSVTVWNQDFSGLLVPFTFDSWTLGIRVSAPLREWIRDPGPPCTIPGTSRCLVPSRVGETIVELDSARDAEGNLRPFVVRVLPAGAAPSSVATDATGRLAFVALPTEGAVAVLDLRDPAPVPFRLPVAGVRAVLTTATQ